MPSNLITPRFPAPPAYSGDIAQWIGAMNHYLVDLHRTYDALIERGLRWENLRSVLITHVFNATPDTADTITHDLGKVPEMYLIGTLRSATAPASPVVYHTIADAAAWTDTTIDLRCNIASKRYQLLVM